MNLERYLEKYIGYKVELYTHLDVRECARRLSADFSTPRLRIPRETVSDRNLAGRIRGFRFTLGFNKKWPEEGVRGNNVLYRVRSFEGQLVPQVEGTRITGSYGYGLGVLFGDVSIVAVGVFLVGALLLMGLVGIISAGPVVWLGSALVLLGLVGVFYWFKDLRPRTRASQRGAPTEMEQEKDHIVRYLGLLLEAKELHR